VKKPCGGRLSGVVISNMRFEARELKPYAEPVTASLLKEGNVYFSVHFADKELIIPTLEAWVFAGRKLDPNDDENHLWFQDVESYREGIRYDSATEENSRSKSQQTRTSITFLSSSARSTCCCCVR